MDNKKDAHTSEQQKDKFTTAKNKLSNMVQNAKRKILEGSVGEAHEMVFNLLSENKQSLGGENSIFLLPGLFIIAQTHILEGRAKKAEEYITAAYWNFLKYNKLDQKTDNSDKDKPKLPNNDLSKEQYLQYKTELHRTFAKLYMLKRDYPQSINELQNSIYLDCIKYGPQHPITSLNYFLMGKIFIQWMKYSQGEAFFGKFAEIWYRYLKNYFKKTEQQQNKFIVNQLALQEALEALKAIQKYFQSKYPEQQGQNVFTPVMRTYYSIGLLYKIFDHPDLCRDYLKEVHRKCELYLPKNDKKILKIKGVLKAIGNEGSEQEVSQNELGQNENQS